MKHSSELSVDKTCDVRLSGRPVGGNDDVLVASDSANAGARGKR